MSGGDLRAAVELMGPEHVNHDPTVPGLPPSPEGVKQLIGMYRFAFPEIRFRTEEMFAADGRVVHHWASRAPTRGRCWAWSRPARG
jgi:hypothetical protein